MTTLERTLLGALSVLLILFAIGLTALAWDQDRQLDLDLGDFQLIASVTAGSSARWAFSLVTALVALFGCLCLAVAMRPASSAGKGGLRLTQADGSVVEVSASALETRLRDELEMLPDVRAANVRVRMVGTTIDPDIAITPVFGANSTYLSNAVVHTVLATLARFAPGANVRRPLLRIDADDAIAASPGVAPRGLRYEPGPPLTGADDLD